MLELFLFAYAVSLTVYHIPPSLRIKAGREKPRLDSGFCQFRIFRLYHDRTGWTQIRHTIDAVRQRQGFSFRRFFKPLGEGDAKVLILLDGSDSFSVQSGYSAASLVSQNYGLQISTQKTDRTGGKAVIVAQAASMPITNSFHVLYNPDFRDLWLFCPPSLDCCCKPRQYHRLLWLLSARGSGDHWTNIGNATRPLELLIGKMVPLVVLCFLIIGIILTLGVFWFGVAFKGSIGLYLLLSLFLLHPVWALDFWYQQCQKISDRPSK